MKVDYLHDLLEKDSTMLACSLTFVGLFLSFYMRRLQESRGKQKVVHSDGTAHVCEGMVMFVKFMDDEWCIQQCVCHLTLLKMSDRERRWFIRF